MFLMPDGIAVNLRLWARGSKKAVVDNGVTMTDPPVKLQSIDYGIGATPSEEGFDPIKAAMVRFFTVAQIVYILTTGISKLGAALVLLRVADKYGMRSV
ncbi:hypothetical protein BGZ61DRAFT_530223 [Ilyonectria robusta]|uniref:uncharacterized protein n=1 Tax=Ilyonectria robusta TaxID=1079257 RepID=UPI001E8E85F1|nr:uncharacterized protein BGZ61DRAFT_530223 [Ilyonectria robusta]KAH8721698.1 hypothetical protein BGZ61DRAFT_530223 [Ilyonectria robusta]